jgi:hypothetical protein
MALTLEEARAFMKRRYSRYGMDSTWDKEPTVANRIGGEAAWVDAEGWVD